MKKILSFSLILVTLLMTLVVSKQAYADVIIEPVDDFYSSHSAECKGHNRSYLVNGSKGYIEAYTSPESSVVNCYIQNNNEVYISFTYTDSDGKLWGITPDIPDIAESDRSIMKDNIWIPMDELILIYDNISFSQDHRDEFELYDQEMKDYQLKDQIYLWTYPGSGEISGKITQLDDKFTMSYTYVDSNGYKWGFAPYYYVQKGWVCISAPESTDIPAVDSDIPVITPAQPVPSSTIPPMLYLVIAFVLIIVLFTAGLIHIKMPKK